MNAAAVQAEMLAHNSLLESLPINADVVSEIDRHLKSVENQLNERLVHLSTTYVSRNFVPEYSKNKFATQVDDELWADLSFNKKWLKQPAKHEELSFQKCTKGYSLYYTSGEVVYDVGVSEDLDTSEWYYRIVADHRETFKVTGASVEVKLRAFNLLSDLLMFLTHEAEHLQSGFPL